MDWARGDIARRQTEVQWVHGLCEGAITGRYDAAYQFNNGHCSLRMEAADPGVAQRRVPVDGVDSSLGDLGDFRPLRVGASRPMTG